MVRKSYPPEFRRRVVDLVECGSDNCGMTAWVHVNSNEMCDGEGPGEQYWCPQCADHPRRLVQRKHFLRR